MVAGTSVSVATSHGPRPALAGKGLDTPPCSPAHPLMTSTLAAVTAQTRTAMERTLKG